MQVNLLIRAGILAVLLLIYGPEGRYIANAGIVTGGPVAAGAYAADTGHADDDPANAIENTETFSPPESFPSAEPAAITMDDPGRDGESQQNRENGTSMQWTTYTDSTFGYSLSFPPIYTILAERQKFQEIAPDLLGRLRFLEPSLANSDFADMEPPKFSLEIYSNTRGQSLPEWIEEHLPAGEVEDVIVDNKICAQLTLAMMLAPNQFVLCRHRDKIFKFTPLGPKSYEMLASFRFGPQ